MNIINEIASKHNVNLRTLFLAQTLRMSEVDYKLVQKSLSVDEQIQSMLDEQRDLRGYEYVRRFLKYDGKVDPRLVVTLMKNCYGWSQYMSEFIDILETKTDTVDALLRLLEYGGYCNRNNKHDGRNMVHNCVDNGFTAHNLFIKYFNADLYDAHVKADFIMCESTIEYLVKKDENYREIVKARAYKDVYSTIEKHIANEFNKSHDVYGIPEQLIKLLTREEQILLFGLYKDVDHEYFQSLFDRLLQTDNMLETLDDDDITHLVDYFCLKVKRRNVSESVFEKASSNVLPPNHSDPYSHVRDGTLTNYVNTTHMDDLRISASRVENIIKDSANLKYYIAHFCEHQEPGHEVVVELFNNHFEYVKHAINGEQSHCRSYYGRLFTINFEHTETPDIAVNQLLETYTFKDPSNFVDFFKSTEVIKRPEYLEIMFGMKNQKIAQTYLSYVLTSSCSEDMVDLEQMV